MHETMRVFYDRLITTTDRTWFKDIIIQTASNLFRIQLEESEIFDEEDNTILFGDFWKKGVSESDKHYEELRDKN